jgi:hypothetical protein
MKAHLPGTNPPFDRAHRDRGGPTARVWLRWDQAKTIPHKNQLLPLPLEVEVVVASAPRIEHRAAAGTLVGTLQILPDRQFHPANPAQDRPLVPLAPRPDFDRVAGQCVVAVLARMVGATALHLDRDDIHWLVVMSAAGLSIKTDSVNMGPRI